MQPSRIIRKHPPQALRAEGPERRLARLRHSIPLALLGLLLLAAPAARADRVERMARGRLVDVRILVDGDPTRLYAHDWEYDRHYFEAERGQNYAIELRNRTDHRIGVLIAVDGLNVISGDRSGLGGHESMYVLDPRERAVIRGWRTSLDHVRQFVFVDEERSYAERSGQANGDMGWIRVLAFDEQQRLAWRPWPYRRDPFPRDRRDGASPYQGDRREKSGNEAAPAPASPDGLGDSEEAPRSGSADAGKPSAGVRDQAEASDRAGDTARRPPETDRKAYPGTGWGDRKRDPIEYTDFAAASGPTDSIVLRYEYERGLRDLGFLQHRDRMREREDGEYGFARPPRW